MITNKFSKSVVALLYECNKNPNQEFTKEELAQATPSNYSFNSGSFGNAISRLNSIGLLKRNNGNIQLNPDLMEI